MRVATSSFMRTPNIDSRVETAEGQGAYEAARGLSQAADTTAKLVERNQRLQAAADITELKAGMASWITERENSGDIDDLPNRLTKEMAARYEGMKKQGGFYAQAMQEAMPTAKAQLSGLAENAVVNATLAKNRDAVNKIIANTTVLTRAEPHNMEANIASAKAQINEAFLSPDEKKRLIEKGQRDIAFVAANEALAVNPSGLRKAIRAGVFKDYLGVDEQQRFLVASVEQSGAVKTNPAVYAELTERAERGENVVAAARAAMLNGLLTIADYDKIRNANPNRRALFDYIHTTTTQGFVPDVAQLARLAEAQNAANRWLHENPNASTAEVERQGRIIVRNFKLNQRANTVISESVKNKVLNEFYFASDGSSAAAPTRAGLKEMVENAKRNRKLDKAKIRDLQDIAYALTVNMDLEEAQKIGEKINGK